MARHVPFHIVPRCREVFQRAGLTNVPACLAYQGGEVVKAAIPGRETKRLMLQDQAYYLKSVRGRGVGDILTEAESLEFLGLRGLPVPAPVAFGVEQGQGVLFTLALPAERSLEELLQNKALSPERVEGLWLALADLVRSLHSTGMNHRDLYAGHVMVDAKDRLYLLDFGRAQRHARVPRRRVVKDLAAVWFSCPERVVGGELRKAWISRYLGGDASRRTMLRLERQVERKASRMLVHARHMLARGEPNIHINE